MRICVRTGRWRWIRLSVRYRAVLIDVGMVSELQDGRASGQPINRLAGYPTVTPVTGWERQTRGAYSIEWNGQSRSSHSRTVR